jgi:hypothetical protein
LILVLVGDISVVLGCEIGRRYSVWRYSNLESLG